MHLDGNTALLAAILFLEGAAGAARISRIKKRKFGRSSIALRKVG